MLKKNKYLPFLISIILYPLTITGQADTSGVTVKNDSASTGKAIHSLFGGGGAGSNMIYLGSTISQDQPYFYGSVTYGFKEALYVSVSTVHLANCKPFSAFSTASVSYNKTVNSWLDISASFSGYKVAEALKDTLFNNFLYGDLTIGLDWKILYTRLSAGELWAGSLTGYYQVRNSRYFEIPLAGGKKFNLSIDPYANLVLGNISTSESSGKTINTGNPFKNNGPKKTITTTKYTTSFGLVELDFGLPVSFNAPRFTVEAEPGFTIPLYDDPDYPGAKGFLFLLSAVFRLFHI